MVIFTQPVCLAALNHLPREKLFLLSRLTSSFHSLLAYMGQQFQLERLNPLNYLQERATWRRLLYICTRATGQMHNAELFYPAGRDPSRILSFCVSTFGTRCCSDCGLRCAFATELQPTRFFSARIQCVNLTNAVLCKKKFCSGGFQSFSVKYSWLWVKKKQCKVCNHHERSIKFQNCKVQLPNYLQR
jgi:hypothetical protein